ncbi:M20 metallopeptidase family protein [Niabella ginsengisoli]|uniref:M20 family metallopeptidase n=1 Tax=Niabella ginsengisoli TaxID=522298 RepID=A0ABS9SH55_9BACT|nr:M20 family metallopeptidase [Niabella ginsengisoli]MCH5597708.1 M20 family metallopeptidase [Niabella ginsengisoli]
MPDDWKDTIPCKKYAPEFIEVRRHLHANPELSYQEFQTSAFVQSKLSELNIPFEIKAQTGVIGLIKGKNPDKKVIALRADMDALPILEANDVSYKSLHEGIMHACGHDVHTTCLLGAAKILNELKEEWEGTIKLIFQPGEEKNPGGASLLINEGVLENPAPDAIFGLHVHPALPTGKVSFRSGKVMASADELYFIIKGKGGHAAAPQSCIDPILIASHLVIALQQVISRRKNPLHPSVLSITAFNGGTTTNVIPGEVKLMGTFRAMDEAWRFEAHEIIKTISNNLVTSMGGELDLHIDVGYPNVFNNEELTNIASQKAIDFMGAENVEETEIRMGAEDFGYYTQKIPGCFYRLGVMSNPDDIRNVHTPVFDINEEAIEIGMGMMAWLGASVEKW